MKNLTTILTELGIVAYRFFVADILFFYSVKETVFAVFIGNIEFAVMSADRICQQLPENISCTCRRLIVAALHNESNA